LLNGVTALAPPAPRRRYVFATSRALSSVPVYCSLKYTPDDICSRWRSDVRPYSVPASSGT
jgi:hypothetical protein